MLDKLVISNYILAENVEIRFSDGLTAITGETGAGKSMIVRALLLLTGGKSSKADLKNSNSSATIAGFFNLKKLPRAIKWLEEHLKISQQNKHICIIKRVIESSGRSRVFINNTPSSVKNLRALSCLLLWVQGQHAQIKLLKSDTQLMLLDEFAGATYLSKKVFDLATRCRELKKMLLKKKKKQQEAAEQKAFLAEQVAELQMLALGEDELSQLECEYGLYSQAGSLLANCRKMHFVCISNEEGSIYDILSEQVQQLEAHISHGDKSLNTVYELSQSALLQLKEAMSVLSTFTDHFQSNPERLSVVKERLDLIYQLSQKYNVNPDQLNIKLRQLKQSLDYLEDIDNEVKQYSQMFSDVCMAYTSLAKTLSSKRIVAAKQMEQDISQLFRSLGMAESAIAIEIQPVKEEYALIGAEQVSFLFSANKGSALLPLMRSASGGELSRLSLITVLIIHKKAAENIPTLLFDEVDTGLGGAIAEKIGCFCRKLASGRQIITITHQPRVAVFAKAHLQVEKRGRDRTPYSQVVTLNTSSLRVNEIARMLGGALITPATMNHADEMLEGALNAN